MNDIRIFKEQLINNYMSELLSQFPNPEDINIDIVRNELAQILQETPAIRLKYKPETFLLEDGSKEKKYEKLEYIEITYTYDSLLVDKTIPIPVTLPYQVGLKL